MDNKLTEYVLKHSKKRDKELKYDFMPSLLEIIERPAHVAGTIIIMGIFTLLVIAVIWACFSKIDVVVTAGGNVQPVGNINVVQSYSGGTIKSINVTEGEYVKAGDVLIELSTESLEINENQLISQKKILEVQQDIYEKVLNGEDLSTINYDEYEAEFRTYIQAIIDSDTSYKNTLADLEMEKTSAGLNLQMAQMQLTIYQESGMVRQIQTQELVVQQYEIESEQIELRISDAETKYSAQINLQLSEINTQLDEINTSLEQYFLSKEYQMITAPVNGYVNSISVNTIGETVTSAQELVTIVPDDTPVEVLCYVQNRDIADIELGMGTEIKLEAYPYNTYGTIKGTVKYISPSSFVSEQLGSVYLVRIEITDKNDNIDIISGLSGSVEIKIGTRTVMQYFLEPITKGFGESLKEK